MASIFRDPVRVTFVDPDNRELFVLDRPDLVPRVGENVRLKGVPYVVERVGWDYPLDALESIWIVCHPA